MGVMLFIGGDFKDKELIKDNKDLFDKHINKIMTEMILREIECDFEQRTGKRIEIKFVMDDMPRLEIDFIKK